MKMATTWCLVALLVAPVTAVDTNPLAKVIQLIDDLEAKVVAEGKAEEKSFGEYLEWAKTRNRELGFEIKTLTSQIAKLEATIAEQKSAIDTAATNIEDLAAAIATDEGELASATKVRNEEHADFLGVEKELVESIDMLQRAIAVLSREMSKNPASFAQMDTSNTDALIQSLSAVISAAGFNTHDKNTLVAMVQADAQNDEEGAPAAAAYKSKSGGIVDTLDDMQEKADGELSDARKAETTQQHNFDMLAQGLKDSISDANKDLDNEKANKAAAEETLATAEGDLAKATESLANAQKEQKATQDGAMQTSADHQKSMDGRNAELTAIRTARKILKETTGGAVGQSYDFMQVQTRTDLANAEIVNLVKKLSQQHHSAALAQLSSQISAVLKMGGDDPFAKVKGLITDMIGRLEKEAADEATEKAFCDEEMAKTEAKKSDLEGTVAKLSAKIDKAAARSASLKAEVKELQAELAALAKQQAEMDSIRQEQNADYLKAKEELELGIGGVRKALTVLRDYYASADFLQTEQPEVNFHKKSGGAGGGIISILEVCESDFSKNLAEEETAESDAQAEYDTTTQENKVTNTMKEQDVKYKTQEHVGLDKKIASWSGDRDTTNTELSAVNDYYSKLKDRCIAKPETYEERKARREAEISGLKQALEILESETAFMQSDRRFLRH